MSGARERILARLRQNLSAGTPPAELTAEREREWLARQPPVADLAARFVEEQEKVGGKVIRVPDWEAFPESVMPWFEEYRITSVVTGAVERLKPLRARLAARPGMTLHTYSDSLERQKRELFSVECGVTTTWGGLADTGSVMVWPTREEPRLLSLAMPIHLAVVERERLFPNLAAFLERAEFQGAVPSNFVLVTGPSRTADIEMILTIGVHGPKVLLVALIG